MTCSQTRLWVRTGCRFCSASRRRARTGFAPVSSFRPGHYTTSRRGFQIAGGGRLTRQRAGGENGNGKRGKQRRKKKKKSRVGRKVGPAGRKGGEKMASVGRESQKEGETGRRRWKAGRTPKSGERGAKEKKTGAGMGRRGGSRSEKTRGLPGSLRARGRVADARPARENGLAAAQKMLMCHKVTLKNLIDSSPIFRMF